MTGMNNSESALSLFLQFGETGRLIWCCASMALLYVISLISFLFACDVDADASQRKYLCREASPTTDCVLNYVFIKHAESQNVRFGLDDVTMNNQTSIRFKDSFMTKVPASLLYSFYYAETLNLSALQITEIDPPAFLYGGSLKVLDLNGNEIEALSSHAFRNLRSLEILTMDRNELSNLEINTFFGTRNLQALSMMNNKLEQITDGTFRWMQSLEYLNVAGNALTHIDISMISSLKHANVSFNQLQEITIPSEVEILDASHNHIRTVASGTNKYLTKLNLSFNGITGTAWLHQFPSLKELDLSYNELEEITFHELRTIHNIEQLLLSNNRLTVLDLREPIQSLRVLDVSHNGLVHVENNQKQFETLKQLHLDHNSLVTLRIGRTNTLQKVTLANNDWDCKNIRRDIYHNIYLTVVHDRDNSCEVGFHLEYMLCCKEVGTDPYLDRLNEQIKAMSRAEKLQRADGHCSAASALSDALSLASFAKNSEAEQLYHRSRTETDISRLENDIIQLKNVVQRDNMTFLGLHDEIDTKIRRYRVSIEGNLNECVNLRKVFKQLDNRYKLKLKESKNQQLEVNGKLNEVRRLEEENKNLETTRHAKKQKEKNLKLMTAALRTTVQKQQARKNNNRRTQQING